jgi:hypothetical protein
MSFVMFLIVGLSVGAIIYAMAYDRFPLGIVGSLAVGVAAALAGGCLGAVIAGAPLTEIRPATAGGTALGAYAAVAIVAGLIHWRHTHGDLGPLMRRLRR